MNFMPCQLGLRFSSTLWWSNWGFIRVAEDSPLAKYYDWLLALGPVSILRMKK